jgi:hypothetical protein
MSLFKRFPSYDQVLRAAAETFRRFPFALLSMIVTSGLLIALIRCDKPADEYLLQRLSIVFALGLPLFLSLTTFAESRRWGGIHVWGLQAVGAVLLAAYFFTLPENVVEPSFHAVRASLLAIGLHFLVACGPWLGGDRMQGFWQYNKTLFLRFLTAALYSAVLYIGLSIALAAADHLFGMDVPWERYAELWVLIAGIFNTWLFLAGVPADLHGLNADESYPKGLKVFAQFVLLPLVGLYFVILIAYEAKIVIEWNWPKGWVSQLVLWYSVVGILSLLLLYPLRNLAESRWVRTFTNWYFRLLVPLVVMLFFALSERISDYGITENRYLAYAMAVGLAVVTLYFIFSKAKDIRVIPTVLCLLALLSSFGPWGAFAESQASQQGRLEALLVKNGLWVDGSLAAAAEQIAFEDRREMSSIIAYLNEWHGLESIEEYLSEAKLAELDSAAVYNRPEKIALALGFEHVSRWATDGTPQWFELRLDPTIPIGVADYDFMIDTDDLWAQDSTRSYLVDRDSVTLTRQFRPPLVTLTLSARDQYPSDSVSIDLTPRLHELLFADISGALEPDQLSFDFTGNRMWGRLICRQLAGTSTADSLTINRLQLQILMKIRS